MNSAREQCQIERFPDGLQPRVGAVQMIAHVKAVAHLPRIGGIGEGGVEARNPVEGSAVHDPVVDLRARRLACFGPVSSTLLGADRRADHLDALVMRPGDNLFEAGDDLFDRDLRLIEPG